MPYNAQNLDENEMYKLAPTISRVRKESNKIAEDQNEYKNLFKELSGSEFIAEMKKLRTNIVN